MCGIAGVLSIGNKDRRKLEYIIKNMNHIQKHRGPDDERIWVSNDNRVALGHVRLSIIDIKFGSQPMTDDEHTITFNGEIYNYIELDNDKDHLHQQKLSK